MGQQTPYSAQSVPPRKKQWLRKGTHGFSECLISLTVSSKNDLMKTEPKETQDSLFLRSYCFLKHVSYNHIKSHLLHGRAQGSRKTDISVGSLCDISGVGLWLILENVRRDSLRGEASAHISCPALLCGHLSLKPFCRATLGGIGVRQLLNNNDKSGINMRGGKMYLPWDQA